MDEMEKKERKKKYVCLIFLKTIPGFVHCSRESGVVGARNGNQMVSFDSTFNQDTSHLLFPFFFQLNTQHKSF